MARCPRHSFDRHKMPQIIPSHRENSEPKRQIQLRSMSARLGPQLLLGEVPDCPSRRIFGSCLTEGQEYIHQRSHPRCRFSPCGPRGQMTTGTWDMGPDYEDAIVDEDDITSSARVPPYSSGIQGRGGL